MEAWRQRSHEHLLAYWTDRREMHSEELHSYNRAYYYKNRQRIRGQQLPYQRERQRRYRHVRAQQQLERYWRNPEPIRQKNRYYHRANRARGTEYKRRWRALRRALPGVSMEQMKTLKEKARTR